MAARDIVYFDGLRKLFFIKKRRDRWELPCPSSHPGSCPALPSLPCSSAVEEGHKCPFPSRGDGSPQTGSEWPRGHLPALCHPLRTPAPPLPQLPFPLREPLSAPACCGGTQMFTSCLSPPALSPQPLRAPLRWSPWAGGRCPMLSAAQNLIASCPFPSSDNEKSSRAAASLLGNMWQYTKLHRDFKMVRTRSGASRSQPGPGGEPEGGSRGNGGQGTHPGEPHHPNAAYGGSLLHACFSQSVVPVQVGWGRRGPSVPEQRGSVCLMGLSPCRRGTGRRTSSACEDTLGAAVPRWAAPCCRPRRGEAARRRTPAP